MAKRFCVIGLGSFGQSVALTLSAAGADVLAVDENEKAVDSVKDHVAHAVVMDATSEEALMAQGLEEMDAVIVAINDRFDVTVLVTSLLRQLGVRHIVARAATRLHRRILGLVGAQQLISPAEESGARLARLLMVDGAYGILDLGEGFSILEARAPDFLVGKSVHDCKMRENWRVNLVTVLRSGPPDRTGQVILRPLGVPTADLVIAEGDVLVLFGKGKDIEDMLRG